MKACGGRARLDTRLGIWSGEVESPLIASRSLGRLLGLEGLLFKVECWQPTGSWLDRSASALVAAAHAEGRTGLCVVGVEVWTVSLAIRCAQAGIRFVVLDPTIGAGAAGRSVPAEPVRTGARGWLSALGARTVAVEADLQTLQLAAPAVAEGAGLRLVAPGDPLLGSGLTALVQEIERAGHGERLLVVPGLTGREPRTLAATRRSAAVPLPLNELPRDLAGPPSSIVGELGSAESGDPVRDLEDQAGVDDSHVLSITVSAREADAARRLLAREEGLLASRRGATGLAGLVRAMREDRVRRLRERRMRDVASAVVVVTGNPLGWGDGPPPESDAVPSPPISLSSCVAVLARMLVEPPGR